MVQCDAIFTMECVGDPESCFECAEFVTTCDRCHVAGHTDSRGWESVENQDGQPRVLCQHCYEIETK